MGGQEIVAHFSIATYSKILLHGAKHSTCPVIGLLMGSSNNSKVTVEAVFPVLHGPPVGPLLDVAISIASTLFPNTSIVGVYFSNDRCDTDLAPVYISRIVKSLAEKGLVEHCTVVQLKNSLIENMESFCVNGTQEGRSVTINVKDTPPTKVNASIQRSNLLSQQNIRKFIDFEDHSNEVNSEKCKDSGDLLNLYVDEAQFV